MKLENEDQVETFAKKTYREVTIWDWLGRILPLSVLAVISIAKLFELHSLLDIVIQFSVLIFFIICFIWWYWAIYKIAITVKYMRESHQNFISIQHELKRFKETFKSVGKDPKEK